MDLPPSNNHRAHGTLQTGNCIGERNYGWYMLLLMILILLVILATAAAIMLLIVDCYRKVLQYRSPHDDTEEYHADDHSKPKFSWHALLGDMFGALVFTLLLLFVFRLLCCHFLNISNGQTTRERLDSNKHQQRENHLLEHQNCVQHWRAVFAASFGCCPPPLSFPIAASEGCTMIDTEHQNT
jgi:uncharacterized membrane protein